MPEYRFECAMRDCAQSFRGDDLNAIRGQVVRHWHDKHLNELQSNHDAYDRESLDEKVQIHDGTYTLRYRARYITRFDVLAPIRSDGRFAVPADDDRTCGGCGRYVDEDDLEPTRDNRLHPRDRCPTCRRQRKIAQRREENHSLTGGYG